MRALLAAGGLSLAFAGCGAGREPLGPGQVLQLLARRPDVLFEELGELRPQGDYDRTSSWGEADGFGWSGERHEHETRGAYRLTNQPRAGLRFPAGRAQERELVFELWCPAPLLAEPDEVEVRLNGHSLRRFQPARAPRVERIRAPAEAWIEGWNELEFEVAVRSGSRWEALALAAVSCGPERRVELRLRERTAELPADTGMRYCLQTRSEAELHLAGASPGSGELLVRVARLDPATGAPESFRTLARLEARAGETLASRLELPDAPAAILALEFVFTGDSDARLTLTRLEVAEREPLPVRPPILFVSIDTFAARHLAAYGYARANTPALSALGAEAVVFERCVANAPWTLPSYLSVLTGLYPAAHRVPLTESELVRLELWDAWQLASNRWTLAEALRARGYQTAGLASSHWLSTKYQFDQGFDLYDLQPAFHKEGEPLAGLGPMLAQMALPWLERRPRDVPWFLFVHALDSHGPYTPATPYHDAFAGDGRADSRRAPAGAENQSYGAIPTWMARSIVPEGEPVPRELPLAPIVQRYDETILEVDAHLGRLFEGLKRSGWWDECVVVVTGDHGESFDNGFYNHGALWESVLCVPLFLKLPKSAHGGRRVRQSVQLVDLYPTLLELAGVPSAEGAVHGRSLLPLVRGTELEAVPTFSEGGYVEQYALEAGGWKLIELFPGSDSSAVALLTHPRVPRSWLEAHAPELLVGPLTEALYAELARRSGFAARLTELRALLAGPFYELYELGSDPRETRDRAGDEPQVLERMRRLLEQEKARGLAARARAQTGALRASFSARELEDLRALGYSGDQD